MSDARWLGPYAETDRHADKVTIQDIVDLRKKVTELEDYLSNLEKYVVYLEAGIVDIEMAEGLGRKINVRTSSSS